MGMKDVKRIAFDFGIIIPLLFYIYYIEGYTPTSKWEPFLIGFMLPIFIRLIMWGKDGYKND